MASGRLLGACAVVAVGLYAHVVSAQQSRCLGSLQIGNNLSIAGRCELQNTEVRGNVTLFPGGSLTGRDLRIRGNLEGNRADFVDLEGSRVDGNVNLQEFVGDLTVLASTELRGNVLLTNNRSRLEILNNEIDGDVQARSNTGGVLISGNAIDDDLHCSGNTPPPVGVGNDVDGDSEGQCESLQAEAPEPTPPPPPEPTPPPPATTPPPPGPTPPPEPTPPPPAPTPPPPTSSPPPPTTSPDPLADEGGGAGALGWPALALLVPLLGWRRRTRRVRR